jgi:ribosomal protein S27AE
LREHDGRLVCDECDGMLIAEADLAASIHELDKKDEPVVARPTAQADAMCPRCGDPMQSCDLFVGTHAIGGGFLRCARDGVWMPRDVMVSLYSWAGRRSGPEHHGRPYGSVITPTFQRGTVRGTGPAPGTGMVAVLQGVKDAFSRGPELAISQTHREWPKTHTVFVSALRGNRLTCPVCAGQPLAFRGERWACERCSGCFVENPALVEMVVAMTSEPWELPASAGSAGERKCPACAAAMARDLALGVALDRCSNHGVWFDADELQKLLEQAGMHKP